MRSVTHIFRLFLLLALIAPASLAQAEVGVAPGAKLPHTLELQDQDGTTQSFDTLKGDNGLVIVFVRSLDWCPFCLKQVVELSKERTQFNELGYNLVTISYDTPAQLKSYADKHSVGVTLLSDPASEAIRAFGLLNEDMAMGTRFYGIPHPAVYVVDVQGVVAHKLMEEGYERRPSLDDIIMLLAPEEEEIPSE